jgi:transcriptional regulator of acetoin/glycerol metabolism
VDADFLYDVKGDVLQGLAIAEEPDEPDAKDPAEGDLRQALDECQGKMGVAARQLGLSRQKLYRLMKQAGLEPNDFRPTGR